MPGEDYCGVARLEISHGLPTVTGSVGYTSLLGASVVVSPSLVPYAS